jgi:hypothetical protein
VWLADTARGREKPTHFRKKRKDHDGVQQRWRSKYWAGAFLASSKNRLRWTKSWRAAVCFKRVDAVDFDKSLMVEISKNLMRELSQG